MLRAILIDPVLLMFSEYRVSLNTVFAGVIEITANTADVILPVLRISLWQGFLYPTTSFRRLLGACLILPLSLMILLPPVLLGLGLGGSLSLDFNQGVGLTLATLITCLVVGSFPFTCLAGYMLRCRKQVMLGNKDLPVWSGLSCLLTDGGRMDLLGLWFSLPIVLFGAAGIISLLGSLHSLTHQPGWTALGVALAGSSLGLVLLFAAVLYWIFVLFASPMATLRLALGASPWQAVKLKGILSDISRGWLDYILCCVLVWGSSIVFQLAQAAFWPLILLTFPCQVYLQLVWANLLGQYALAYMPERL